MAHDVFISYSTPNRAVAVAACQALEREGYRCWIAPRDVPPASHYGGAIVKGIKGSRALVLVFSDPANKSPHVLREVERAVAYHVPVLPFRIEDLTLSEDLEYFISIAHWLTALPPPPEHHLPALVAAVRGLLGDSGPAHRPDTPPSDPRTPPQAAPLAAGLQDFTELTGEQAPLLRERPDSLVRFNRLAQLRREVARLLPELFEREPIRRCADEVRFVRERLTRLRFRVLLVGPAEAGKSTTINNLLGLSPQDGPTPVGSGTSRTGSLVRLRAGRPGEAPSAQVRFLTPDQYLARRERLCEVTRLDPALKDEDILRLLADHGAGPESGNLRYLRRLLTTYREHGPAHVREPARVDEVPYAERWRYLQGTPREGPDGPSPALLVQQTVMTPATDLIPQQVELIDLGGLAGEWQVDTFVPEAILDVDGILLFLSATRLWDAQVQHLLDLIRSAFAGWPEGRVWLVLTQLDRLSREVWEGSPGGGSFGDALAAFLGRSSLPASQVCMVSNELFSRPGLPPPDAGPTAFGSSPELLSAYHELGTEGGIRRLRGSSRELPERAAARMHRETDARMSEVVARLHEQIVLDRHRAQEGAEGLRNALLARQVLLEALESGPRWRELLSRLGDTLREELCQALDELLPEGPVSRSASRLAGDFPTHAHLLNRRLWDEVSHAVAPEVYAVLGEPLGRVPEVPVLGAPGLRELWDRYRDEDRARGWHGQVADFTAGTPFPEAPGDFSWSVQAYRDLLCEKIDVVSRQAVHTVYRRARERLASLVPALEALVRDVGPTSRSPGGVDLEGLLRGLREVQT